MSSIATSIHYSIGKSKRKDLNDNQTQKIVPGPGNYDQKFVPKKLAPEWKFGTGNRPSLN